MMMMGIGAAGSTKARSASRDRPGDVQVYLPALKMNKASADVSVSQIFFSH
jgi:hypothetical protein